MLFFLLGGESMSRTSMCFALIYRQICLEEEEGLAVTRQAPDLVGQLYLAVRLLFVLVDLGCQPD
jgi:hypothetical protein